MNLTLYYSPTRAIVFIIASLVWIIFQIQQGTDQLTVRLILPIAMILYCLPRLKKKHLVFKEGVLTVYAGFGPKTRTFSFKSKHDFLIEKNRLYQKGEGQRRIPITEAWAVKKSDWLILKEMLGPTKKPF